MEISYSLNAVCNDFSMDIVHVYLQRAARGSHTIIPPRKVGSQVLKLTAYQAYKYNPNLWW